MRKIHSDFRYDFYIGSVTKENGDICTIYNIVPHKTLAPKGGYYNMQWIEKIKGAKFPDRYQPTKHGMSNLYTNTIEEKNMFTFTFTWIDFQNKRSTVFGTMDEIAALFMSCVYHNLPCIISADNKVLLYNRQKI